MPDTAPTSKAQPLCVDLDGTLLATDTLCEALLKLLQTQPFRVLVILFWLVRGRAAFKRRLFHHVALDPAILPIHADVVAFLRQQKEDGRTLILATGTDALAARPIAEHFGFFDQVIASEGQANLTGREKLRAIRQAIGEGCEFDYMGNSSADLPLWEASRNAYLVEPSKLVQRRAQAICTPAKIFGRSFRPFRDLLGAMRLNQWAKNLLLIVPMAAGHELARFSHWLSFLCAFLAFGLGASAIYLLNDLFDLDADRRHPNKRQRPFAAGRLGPQTGLLAAGTLLPITLVFSQLTLGAAFTAMLLVYVLLANAYSMYFKRKLILDVLFLAGLYTHRIVAGGVMLKSGADVVDVFPTPWLLAFSMFLFLSLAFVKRYAELLRLRDSGSERRVSGRGYVVGDVGLIRSVGTTSGYLAVLVFAFYISQGVHVSIHYSHPNLLWFVCPVLLYWITRLWFLAGRGVIREDPVLFALTDRVSYAAGIVMLAIVIAASV